MHVQMEKLEIAERLCHPDSMGLLTHREERAVPELLNHLARARMDRENDWKLDRDLTKRLQDPEQRVRIVDVRRPVQCQCGEAALLQPKALSQTEVLSRCTVSRERIDHHITDKMYALLGDAFLAQIRIGKAIRGEQVFAQNIGAEPVDFFGHANIPRA